MAELKSRNTRAIYVLEGPWDLYDEDANKSSVLPFIEGMAKIYADVEVYHSRFYNKNSFCAALDAMCKLKHKNAIVYISAHGFKKNVGGLSLIDALIQVNLVSRTYNITGVQLGSCFVGGEVMTMATLLEDSNLSWCAGYKSTNEWLLGTLIDTRIIDSMLCKKGLKSKKKTILVDKFSKALSAFSLDTIIGEDYNEDPVRLGDSISIVVQPKGKGSRGKDVTSEVLTGWFDCQEQNCKE